MCSGFGFDSVMWRHYGGGTIEAFGIVGLGNSSKELGEGFGMVLGFGNYTDTCWVLGLQ